VHATDAWQWLTAGQSLAVQHDAPGWHVPEQHMPFGQLAAPVHVAATHAPDTHAWPVGHESYVHAHAPETHVGVDDEHAVHAAPQWVASSFA
jgi:hypothetical protein